VFPQQLVISLQWSKYEASGNHRGEDLALGKCDTVRGGLYVKKNLEKSGVHKAKAGEGAFHIEGKTDL
jgi:hypothetical protein